MIIFNEIIGNDVLQLVSPAILQHAGSNAARFRFRRTFIDTVQRRHRPKAWVAAPVAASARAPPRPGADDPGQRKDPSVSV